MKKLLKDRMHKKVLKRSVSLLVSVAMLISSSSAFWDILSKDGLFVAHAAQDTYTITTISELVKYSKEYADGNRNSKDTLNIAIASSDDPDKIQYQFTTTVYQYDEFVSIGSSGNAFSGTVNITVDAVSYFNFSKPLFGYITDSATITVSGGSSNGYLELRNPALGRYLPVLAEHVVHDSGYNPGSENDYTNWKVKINYFNEEGADPVYANFPGVIGCIDSNCKLKLDVRNDAVNGDYKQNVEATAAENAAYANAGLLCGTLGSDAKLIASVSGTNNSYNVSSAHGNAGSLIGEMLSGSTLKLSGNNILNGTNRNITSSDKYAGGLVGSAKDCTIEFDNNYTINERINGKSGAGGIAGYYESTSGNTFDLDQASINCTLTSASAGGLFGVLNTTGDFTLNETGHSYSIASTSASQPDGGYYGGLIGTYKTSSLGNTLTIGEVNVTTKGAGRSGGLIGKLDTSDNAVPCYVKIDGATVDNSITGNFAGAVNYAGYKGHMLDIRDFTLTGVNTSTGLVGTMGAGVVRLSGVTDLSAVQCSSAQLVNVHGSALIYAVGDGKGNGWTFRRSNTATASDDIGSWGEVVRLSSSNEYTRTGDSDTISGTDDHIVTFDESNHTVTIQSPTTSIATKNDFIRTALNMQINEGDKGALQFNDDVNNSAKLLGSANSSSSIELTADIDLANTGIMSLMRDDGKRNVSHSSSTSDAAFVGTLNGNGHSITLAVGEPYGMRSNSNSGVNDFEALTIVGTGNGMIHKHSRIGVLAVTKGATVTDLVLSGSIYTESYTDGMCLGGFVGLSKGNLSMTGISENITIKAADEDSTAKYVGGVIGRAEGTGSVISISGSNQSKITVNGDNNLYAANGIGFVSDSNFAHQKNLWIMKNQ